ncbi:4-hydroxythreonine-4-phosphate dehydrogenase PdxA [Geomicrobium sediminis]|uniref:4-hydroxythreonine-4-phosphate dehydrogenase n=1 Tax=Geomicrobium sediminis TaxID=1347788 RepID=A0ABS2PA93_9BACL|nr:4-hydroxythreonine-4-phosphate dehydrogenase PdxA [Geomicrobium sediminis]MBM7632276.1 4-hydroxythreonine-4-phosphate dehydrogenase [Geomicrobium sediminis]
MHKPVIGITMGDAAGVGPEIIVNALQRPEVLEHCLPLVIGDFKSIEKTMKKIDANLTFKSYKSGVQDLKDGIPFLDLNLLPNDWAVGEVSAACGNAAYHYVATAVQLAQDGEIDAICTAPLNKEALHLGGHSYPGHTEILATLTKTDNFSMMLSSSKLNVMHVTTHVGLIDAIQQISPERVFTTIELAHQTLKAMDILSPKIGVCGINPHAGENGLFGYGEEEEKIKPAINNANEIGIDAVGPLPADTLFYLAQRGDYDGVIAMYHDQGHAPIKVLGIDDGVNITIGLPIIRTSVDHGTAFDIAGKNIADEQSMVQALMTATKLANTKSHKQKK